MIGSSLPHLGGTLHRPTASWQTTTSTVPHAAMPRNPVVGRDPIAKYQAEPPSWLTTSHSSADLGYHSFFPPRPDQPEDSLAEHNVKHGYCAPETVGVEHFSSQHMIRDRIINQNALTELEDLMNQILARRAETNTVLPDHVYKLPQRITLSEVRKQQWHSEFLNPDVLLNTIGEKIPHARGQDILTFLQDNKVPVSRAVWYVRGIGANENQGMRNRPGYTPTQYSLEWTNVVTAYLKKLLSDIALPSATRLGLNIKQTFKVMLSDPEQRDNWISKFSYCLDLLREFYAEGLVDHASFLSWLTQQMCTCNLAQANFITRIIDEYLEGMFPYRALQRPLIDACFAKLIEIQTATGSEHLSSLVTVISSLLQRMFIYNPDTFVNPRSWIINFSRITQILHDSPTSVAQDRNEWESLIENDLDDVSRRNDALLFRIIPERATATAKFTMGDVKLLNSITEKANLSSITILDMPFEDTERFKNKVDMLLTWGITSHQYGDHRPYAVATLLACWIDRSESRALRRGFPSPEEMLQEHLFRWLDTSNVVVDEANLLAASILFAELLRRGIFSYSKYIQRLIARGESGLLTGQEPQSRHRPLLKSLPLPDYSAPIANQRKVALYGISCRSTPEEIKERELRRMLRTCLPELFGGSPISMDQSLSLNREVLLSASRYEQVRVLRHWFLPIFDKYLQQPAKRTDGISLQTYTTLMYIMTLTKTYRVMLEVNLKMLPTVTSFDLLVAIVDTIRRHADIWACMDVHTLLLDALSKAQEETWNWASKQAQCRPLLCLLIEFLEHRDMTQVARDRINEDTTALLQNLHPPNIPSQRDSSLLPRIASLIQEDDTSLANNFWARHGFTAHWAQDVWQHTMEALRESQTSSIDERTRGICIMRFAQFLWDIDQHLLPGTLDRLVFQWATGPGRAEFRHYTADNWSALSRVLVYLVSRDVLTAPNVLKGIVYPILEQGAATPLPNIVMLRAAVHLASPLLVPGQEPLPLCANRLEEVQKLQTRRRAVYVDDNFRDLITALPLLVNLESNANLDADLHLALVQLRTTISKDPEFRMVAFRNLELVSKAFWNVDSPETERHLGKALQEILSDLEPCESSSECEVVAFAEPVVAGVLHMSTLDWRTLSSFLSPWRYARTAIELQLELRSLAAGLRDEQMKEKAGKDLAEFGSSFFGQSLSSDETDLIADMLRGISGVVACKLINCGMQRMAQLFKDVVLSVDIVSSLLHNAGEALHLMSSILQPLRSDASGLPTLEPEVQDAFARSLQAVTKQADEACAQGDVPQDLTDLVVLVARLWQFDLCLPGAWTVRMKEVISDVLTRIVQMAIRYSYGVMANSTVFDVLLDTAFVLFDEIPRDFRSLIPDFFQHTPSIPLNSLPPEMTDIQRRRVSSLLAFQSDDAYVSSLFHSWVDPLTNKIVFGKPVQANPWEWGDSIEPQVDSTVLRRERPELKNSSSIPLEVFGTRPTGERVIGEVVMDSMQGEEGTAGRDAMAARQLEDGLAGDNMFERDWRETRRVETAEEGVVGGSQGAGAAATGGPIVIDQHGGESAGMEGTSGRMDLAAASRGSSPAQTIKSHHSSTATATTGVATASASLTHHRRAGSVLSTSSRERSSLGGGEGGETAGTSSGRGKRKASPGSTLEMDMVMRGGTGRGRGKTRSSGGGGGAVAGRGKGKKK